MRGTPGAPQRYSSQSTKLCVRGLNISPPPLRFNRTLARVSLPPPPTNARRPWPNVHPLRSRRDLDTTVAAAAAKKPATNWTTEHRRPSRILPAVGRVTRPWRFVWAITAAANNCSSR